MTRSLVVMGVAGCGKSSVGEALARIEGLRLIEGDSFHDDANIDKMRRGIALTDADREGWLARLGDELGRRRDGGVVLTCSALRRAYRDRLRAASPGLSFVFLDIDRDTALHRVRARAAEHFFSADLVDSQFATLQSPVGEPGVLRLVATAPVEQLQREASAWWHARTDTAR